MRPPTFVIRCCRVLGVGVRPAKQGQIVPSIEVAPAKGRCTKLEGVTDFGVQA
jgi:hypothetical protein